MLNSFQPGRVLRVDFGETFLGQFNWKVYREVDQSPRAIQSWVCRPRSPRTSPASTTWAPISTTGSKRRSIWKCWAACASGRSGGTGRLERCSCWQRQPARRKSKQTSFHSPGTSWPREREELWCSGPDTTSGGRHSSGSEFASHEFFRRSIVV